MKIVKSEKVEEEEIEEKLKVEEKTEPSIVLLNGLKTESVKKGKKRKLNSEDDEIKKKKLAEEAVRITVVYHRIFSLILLLYFLDKSLQKHK